MHAFFSPSCVYASEIDEVNGVTKWSTDGCVLKEVRQVEQTVVCACTHLSRFTAGEDVVAFDADIVSITKKEKDTSSSEAESYKVFPIMLAFVGILLFAIIATPLHEKYKQKERHIRNLQNTSM